LDRTEGVIIMERCDLQAKCYFLNETMMVRPLTTADARTIYCDGDFTSCTIYKVAKVHGMDRVPRYVAPEDSYEFNSRVVEHHFRGNIGR
jgi:hypothetical protein